MGILLVVEVMLVTVVVVVGSALVEGVVLGI